MNVDIEEERNACKMDVCDSDVKSLLLNEFSSWTKKKNNIIKLLQHSKCDDGRICLELSLGTNQHFTLYCPSDYPNYEDNFFAETTTSLQFLCNALNEFILDSTVLLPLDSVLEKVVSLYHRKSNKSPCYSSSDSEPDADLAEEFMVIDADSEEEDWDYVLCQKKKRWRLKEAELRAATKQPKTSDMFDGNIKDHPKQVFSNSGASGILTNDLVAIIETKCKTGINADPIDDNIYQWAVYLSDFDPQGKLSQDLQQLQQKYGYAYIELQLDFTMDLYPFYPPVLKVIRPRLEGSMMLRVASMDLLKLSYWNPARSMKSALQEIKDYLSLWARLDVTNERNNIQRFPQGAYLEIENHLLWLASVTEIPSRAQRRYPESQPEILLPPIPEPEKKKTGKNPFPAGTGFSSSGHTGWDINAYVAAQKEKDKQIESVLQKILQELRKGATRSDVDLKFRNIGGANDTYCSFSIPSCSSKSIQESHKITDNLHNKTILDTNHIGPSSRTQFVFNCNLSTEKPSSDTNHPMKLYSSNATVLNPSHCNNELNGKSPIDSTEDLYNVLEASTLVPFLESKLQVDSFLEISQHTAVYRCVVDIISEIAARPKLVGLLWSLPDQVQSIYTLVSRLEEQAKAVIVQLGKTSSNENISSAKAVLASLNKTSANGNIPSSTKSKIKLIKASSNTSSSVPEIPEEDETLARDFYEMSRAVTCALESQGYLATDDKNGSPSTSEEIPRQPSTSGTLDADQALTQSYKDALKDLQFLSCDIEDSSGVTSSQVASSIYVMNVDIEEERNACKMDVCDSDVKSLLLNEFSSWTKKKNNIIKLLQHSKCDDGRICLELSLGTNQHFTLYCPSDYPNYEDNFFAETTTSLQFLCNALNEFILDSTVLLPLDSVLEKVVSLYHRKSNKSPCYSSSDSEPDADLAEEFMVIDADSEEEDWDYVLCQKKKRWRLKEAELRAATKQPKTSDMFDGNIKDHPKQVFSNSGASGILTNDLVAIIETKCKTGINADPIDDNIYQWAVYLSDFDPQGKLSQDLQQLQQKYGYAYIELQLDFTMDLYPFYPPVLKVIRPRLEGSMMLRVASMDLLKLSYWNPARSMKSALQEIKDYLSLWARLDVTNERNNIQRFPQGAYLEIENHLLWLASVTEIPSRAQRRYPESQPEILLPPIPEPEKKKTGKNPFPAGTGFSSSGHTGWDINAYVAAQKEKDKQIESVLQKILQELRKGATRSDVDLKFRNIGGANDTYCSFSIPSCSSKSIQESHKITDNLHNKTILDTNHIGSSSRTQFVFNCNLSTEKPSSDTNHPMKLYSSNATVLNPSHCNNELNGKSPIDSTEDLYNVLEASTLVPFLESKLQVDSFLEISQHTAVYRCVVDIISEIAARPKLVGLLWSLPDQVQSIYTLVSRLEEQAKAVIVQLGKTSSNENISSAKAVLASLNKTSANGNIPSSTKSKIKLIKASSNTSSSVPEIPEEDETLARDFYEMSRAVTCALESQGYLATDDKNGSPSTSEQIPRQPSTSGTLDADQALTQSYKDALKDLQFLSCDIEVEGASAHHHSTQFKKALPPNSAQVLRIAQEMAALSTSLPLDLGSAIFVRTDDARCTLLRALIIGPEGTPYSGGCFQFDIFFPPQYPTVPPHVHFCTTGLGRVRFNPNLYSSGTVCLSLLGTWKGLQGEQWNKTSTLLQVLISIQSLILVPEPYFNEPGYETLLGTPKGNRCSQSYNEDIILQTINHAMISQLQRPSSGFEDVIRTHFQVKKERILKVLISIQSLILVPEPYFNEPGYETLLGTPKGNRCSQSYNEDIILQTINHAMISQLQRPSSGFEDVIRTHFQVKKERILKVLISIQSLILVPEPYFNEPGYETLLGTPKGNRCSQSYNEDIILQTINHAMISQLQRPSSGFEDVIRTHFQVKKERILKEIYDHCQQFGNKGALKKAFNSLKAELDKLPPYSCKTTGCSTTEENAKV